MTLGTGSQLEEERVLQVHKRRSDERYGCSRCIEKLSILQLSHHRSCNEVQRLRPPAHGCDGAGSLVVGRYTVGSAIRKSSCRHRYSEHLLGHWMSRRRLFRQSHDRSGRGKETPLKCKQVYLALVPVPHSHPVGHIGGASVSIERHHMRVLRKTQLRPQETLLLLVPTVFILVRLSLPRQETSSSFTQSLEDRRTGNRVRAWSSPIRLVGWQERQEAVLVV